MQSVCGASVLAARGEVEVELTVVRIVAIASDRIADMPDAVAMHASAPSIAASRVCIAVTVGLEKRA